MDCLTAVTARKGQNLSQQSLANPSFGMAGQKQQPGLIIDVHVNRLLHELSESIPPKKAAALNAALIPKMELLSTRLSQSSDTALYIFTVAALASQSLRRIEVKRECTTAPEKQLLSGLSWLGIPAVNSHSPEICLGKAVIRVLNRSAVDLGVEIPECTAKTEQILRVSSVVTGCRALADSLTDEVKTRFNRSDRRLVEGEVRKALTAPHRLRELLFDDQADAASILERTGYEARRMLFAHEGECGETESSCNVALTAANHTASLNLSMRLPTLYCTAGEWRTEIAVVDREQSFEYGAKETGRYSTQFLLRGRIAAHEKTLRRQSDTFTVLQEKGAFSQHVRLAECYIASTYIRQDKPPRTIVDILIDSPHGISSVALRNVWHALHDPIKSVQFVTGPCLWSAFAAQALTTDGRTIPLTHRHIPIDAPIASLAVQDQPTLYEVDMVERTTRVISTLATDNPKASGVSMLIPSIEYKLYLFDALSRGWISNELMEQWGTLVDRRRALLRNVLADRLPKQLLCSDIQMLEPINAAVYEAISGKVEVNERLLAKLVSILRDADPLWEHAFQRLQLKEHNKKLTWNDLSIMGYALSYAKVATSGDHLTVGVENHEEEPIFINVESLLRPLKRSGSLLAVLSRPLVMLADQDDIGLANLYYARAQPSLDQLSLVGDIESFKPYLSGAQRC